MKIYPYQPPQNETPDFRAMFVDGPVQVSVVATRELMGEVHWACRRRWYVVPRCVVVVAGVFLLRIAAGMTSFSGAGGRSSMGVAVLLAVLGLAAVCWALYVRRVVNFLNREFNDQRARDVSTVVVTMDENFFTFETGLAGTRIR